MYIQCTCLFFVYLVSRFVSHTDVKMHIEYVCIMLLLTNIILYMQPATTVGTKDWEVGSGVEECCRVTFNFGLLFSLAVFIAVFIVLPLLLF